MYLEHFGLRRRPFKITPDTSLFYKGNKRGASLEALKYAIESGEGIVKVIGEVGSGKTMLCRMLEQELSAHIEIVYISNPSLSPENILPLIAFELSLKIENPANKLELMQSLQYYLLQKHAQNKQVLVLVEEAQSMPVETLEEIRLLSNLETDDHKLLQMVLFAQPELDETLKLKEIRQLKERITHSFYLEPFNNEDIYEYLNYRMYSVGYRGPDIFSSKVISTMSKESLGLTRRINILADKALLAVYAEGGHELQKKHIQMAAQDSEFSYKKTLNKWWWFVPIVLVLMLVSVWAGMQISRHDIIVDVRKNNIQKEALNKSYQLKEIKNIFSVWNTEREVQATHSWLKNLDENKITIQLMLQNETGLKRFVKQYKGLIEINKLHIYTMKLKGKEVYSLVYGDYENIKEAGSVLAKMDKKIQVKGAYLRSIKGINHDIRKNIKKESLENNV